MPYEILMPRLGWNMEEGQLVEWLKEDGDPVQSGDLLCTIEGDKATTEIESFETGTLRIPSQAPPPGKTVPVGTVLGYVVSIDEQAEFDPESYQAAPVPVPEIEKPSPTPVDKNPTVISDETNNKIRISPRAKRIADELGIDWSDLEGSGRTGRIIEADIREAAEKGNSLEGDPLQGLRRITAERMATASQTTAPVTMTTEADATALVELRNSYGPEVGRPSYNDLLIKICGIALAEFPIMNSTFQNERIILHNQINIGLAVQTERGLVVPVVCCVEEKSVLQISKESSAIISAAKSNALKLNQIENGTFTITNLGNYDIDFFTPIINTPQCAILGIGRISPRIVVLDEDAGLTGIRKMMPLNLTFDHRLTDGAPAAQFLQRIKQLVESPSDLS